MQTKDITIKINQILWNKMEEKISLTFGNLTHTNSILFICFLSLYKPKDSYRSSDNIYHAIDSPLELNNQHHIRRTISIYTKIIERMKINHPEQTYSQLITYAITDFLVIPYTFYTNNISPIYTIVGSKNKYMQKKTSDTIRQMNLQTDKISFIDICTGTGSLFFGIDNYTWKKITLNDLNPLRTNFLKVLKEKIFKFIKMLLETDFSFINIPDEKNRIVSEYKTELKAYEQKRKKYKKVDKNIDIAYKTFIVQCIDRAHIESHNCIFDRMVRFFPAHLKLRNVEITQIDCLEYAKDSTPDKILLIDPPYIGSETFCAISDYNYANFHSRLSDMLQQAHYPFLYFCRSSVPKTLLPDIAEHDRKHVLKMKLAEHFFNKGFFFENYQISDYTELIISNRHYSNNQFEWTDLSQNLY